MNKTEKAFLFRLLQTPSPTGWEADGQRIWAKYANRYSDKVNSDAYGNAWATLKGSNKRPRSVMLEAHADEIGFIVKHISDDGYLYVDRLGGIDHATGRGRRVTIMTEKGTVPGVIGNTAIHIRDRNNGEKAPEVYDLYVDIGASKRKEVMQMGIRVGNPMVYSDRPEEFGNGRIVGRALDNRIGGFIIAQVMKRLSKDKPHATVHAANCVHEEIGGLGARMVAHRLKPDVCVVLDVTHATDSPGIKTEKHGSVTLGDGPTLTHGAANQVNVVKRLMKVAKKAEIPLQHEAASRFTGTDADGIYHSRDGIPTALVSLPLRYMHSVVEMADLKDVESVIHLLTEFAKSIRLKDRFDVSLLDQKA